MWRQCRWKAFHESPLLVNPCAVGLYERIDLGRAEPGAGCHDHLGIGSDPYGHAPFAGYPDKLVLYIGIRFHYTAPMNESADMILHLQQTLPYRHEVPVQPDATCALGFDTLLECLDNLPPATDACLACRAVPTDELLVRQPLKAAYSLMKEIQADQTSHFTIAAGDYRFRQLQWTPSQGTALEPVVANFLAAAIDWTKPYSDFFIRLFKERPFEVVVQLLTPLVNTTAE